MFPYRSTSCPLMQTIRMSDGRCAYMNNGRKFLVKTPSAIKKIVIKKRK